MSNHVLDQSVDSGGLDGVDRAEGKAKKTITWTLSELSAQSLRQFNSLVLDDEAASSDVVSADITGSSGAVAVRDRPSRAGGLLVSRALSWVVDGVRVAAGLACEGRRKFSAPNPKVCSKVSQSQTYCILKGSLPALPVSKSKASSWPGVPMVTVARYSALFSVSSACGMSVKGKPDYITRTAYWNVAGLTTRGVLLGENMATNVSSASDFLASLLEDGLLTLLVNLVDSAVRTLNRWANVPLLHGVDVRLEAVASMVGVSLQSAADEFGVGCHVGWFTR